MPKETNKQTLFTQPLHQIQKLTENKPHRPNTKKKKKKTTNFLEKIEGKIFVTSGRHIFLIHDKHQKHNSF